MQTKKVMGIPFVNSTQEDFNKQLETDLENHESRFIVTANPEIVLYARDNPDYMKIILNADYITPDGIGIVMASEQLGNPLKERITGYDTMVDLIETADKHEYSIYFLGAKQEVLDKVLTKIKNEYPGVKISGSHNGYYDDKEQEKIEQEIRDTSPNIVLVATGYPKQEEFINKNYRDSHAIWMGIGGSFDTFSGEKKRAPELFQKTHTEWLFRLIQEPSRIGRMSAIPRFVKEVHNEKKKMKQNNN